MRERVFVTYQRVRSGSPRLRQAVRMIPGAHWLHRRLYEGIRPDEVAVRVHGFSVLVNPRDEVLASHLLHGKGWEPYVTQLFTDAVQPGMIVVDIGANIGYYTLLAARAVGPQGKVIAFEPDPVNFDLLSRNVSNSGFGERVTLIRSAVGNHNGTVTLFRDPDNLGAHSLAVENLVDSGSVEVQCTTLTDALRAHSVDALDLVKIDTQGAEGLVFDGARELILGRPTRVFMEYWPSGLRHMGTDPGQLLRMLTTELGFEMLWIDHEHSRVVKVVDPDDVTARCGDDRHVDLVLERS